METFKHSVEIAAAGGGYTAMVEMVMATEFACIEVPERIRRELEIEPVTKCSTVLADGRHIEMDIGRTWVTVDGRKDLRMVVLGDDDAPTVFGVFARVLLDFIPDPGADSCHYRSDPDSVDPLAWVGSCRPVLSGLVVRTGPFLWFDLVIPHIHSYTLGLDSRWNHRPVVNSDKAQPSHCLGCISARSSMYSLVKVRLEPVPLSDELRALGQSLTEVLDSG